MSASENSGVLHQWYRTKIGRTDDDGEVYGYWVFVFGVLLGVLGITLYITRSGPGTYGIALAAVALVLLLVGPVLRLPLERQAAYVSYLGAVVALVAVAWFLTVFPGWRAQSTQIISVYGAGMLLVAIGAILVPVVTGDVDELEEVKAQRDAAAAERDEAAAERDEVAAERDQVAEERDQVAEERDEARAAVADREAAIEEIEAEMEALKASKAQFEVYEDAGGKYRWRLVHRNGNIIATGGQGYSSRQKATQGLESVVANAIGADVYRLESDDAPEEVDEEGAIFEPYPEGETRAEFEVYEDTAGDHRWRLRHENGNVVADGGQGYASASSVRNAVDRVRTYVGPAQYLRIDPTAFEVFKDKGGKWRWRLVHKNGNILADGGQGYSSRTRAKDGIESVRNLVEESAEDEADHFEVYEDAAGEYRWRLVHPNGNNVANGSEGYSSEGEARNAVGRIQEYAPDADELDYHDATFEVYEDQGGDWRWRLRHRNGRIMSDSGQGYSSRTGALDGIDSVKRNAPNAPVGEADAGATDAGDTDVEETEVGED